MLPIAERVLAHRRTMGSSIWEYLWLLAHVTKEDPVANGKALAVVDHGNPISTNRIAAALGRSRDATLANLEKLEAGNYIERSAAVGHAYEYKVQLLTE
jgi:biotin operon repressor